MDSIERDYLDCHNCKYRRRKHCIYLDFPRNDQYCRGWQTIKYQYPPILRTPSLWANLDDFRENGIPIVTLENSKELKRKFRDIHKAFQLAINWQRLAMSKTAALVLLRPENLAPPDLLENFQKISDQYEDFYKKVLRWEREQKAKAAQKNG